MPKSQPRSIHSISSSLLICAVTAFFDLAKASLSLQELQAIAQFPPNCETAYQTPIKECPNASSFSAQGGISNPSFCDRYCFYALNSASLAIQTACQGTSAPPGTVIAHAFMGDLSVFLCTPGTGSSSESSSNPTSTSGPDVSTSPTESPSSTNSQSESSASSTDSSSDQQSSTATSDVSSTSTQSDTASTSTESTSSPSDSTASTSSSSSITTTTSSSPSSTSSSSKSPGPTLNPGGGGSPFDQVVPNTGSSMSTSRRILPTVIGILTISALGVSF